MLTVLVIMPTYNQANLLHRANECRARPYLPFDYHADALLQIFRAVIAHKKTGQAEQPFTDDRSAAWMNLENAGASDAIR